MLSAAAPKLKSTYARRRHRIIGMAMLVPFVCLGSCTMLDPNVPAPELELPDAYIKKSSNPKQTAASPYDFAVFKSHRLTELIALGRGFNFDISASIARIQQSEALVRVATQPLIPTIQAQGSASASLMHRDGQAIRTTMVTAQLMASYEIDFWGKNHAALNSAIANQYVSSFDSMTVAITTDANVATTYFNAIGTQKQIDIAKKNLAIAQRTLTAIEARFKAGTASGLDTAQQETLVANVKVTIPPLERQLEQFKHALAVLVGTAPEFFQYKGEDLYSVAVPNIPPGLPSELLCRRPDICFRRSAAFGTEIYGFFSTSGTFPLDSADWCGRVPKCCFGHAFPASKPLLQCGRKYNAADNKCLPASGDVGPESRPLR